MFHYLSLRTHCHATEDEEKVKKALWKLFPAGEILEEKVTGHFGNPLTILRMRITSRREISRFWEELAEAGLIEPVSRDTDMRIDDELNLHLRLDKQEAYLGRLALTDSDDAIVIRGKIRAFPATREVAMKIAGEFLANLR